MIAVDSLGDVGNASPEIMKILEHCSQDSDSYMYYRCRLALAKLDCATIHPEAYK